MPGTPIVTSDEVVIDAIRAGWGVARLSTELHCSSERAKRLAAKHGLSITVHQRHGPKRSAKQPLVRRQWGPRTGPLSPHTGPSSWSLRKAQAQPQEPKVLCEGCGREGLKVPAVYKADKSAGTEAQCWYCRNGQGHPLLLRRLTHHPDAPQV